MPYLKFWFMAGLLLTTALLQGQDSQQPSGVLVLKDGRMIATRGEIEVLKDEVQFTSSSGQLLSLPLDRIDLAATRRQNQRLEDGLMPDETSSQLVDHVEAQAERGPDDRVEIVIGPNNTAAPIGEDQPEPPKTGRYQEEWGWPYNQDERLERLTRRVENMIEDPDSTHIFVSLGLLVLLLITSLISLGTQIYIIIISFQEGVLWGFSLVVSFLGSIFLPFIGLLNFVLVLAFIMVHCAGARLKLLFLWLLPILIMFAWLAHLFVAIVPWSEIVG